MRPRSKTRERAFWALQRGAKAAADEGSSGLFEGLFQRTAAVVAPRRGKVPKAKAAAGPAP